MMVVIVIISVDKSNGGSDPGEWNDSHDDEDRSGHDLQESAIAVWEHDYDAVIWGMRDPDPNSALGAEPGAHRVRVHGSSFMV